MSGLFLLTWFLILSLTSPEPLETRNPFQHHPDGKLIIPKENTFDWLAYLELFPEAHRDSKNGAAAITHYEQKGKKKKDLVLPYYYPPLESLVKILEKLYAFTKKLDAAKVPTKDRTFVSYYLAGRTDPMSSKEVLINNELLFNASMATDSNDLSTNFYWITVSGAKRNNLQRFLYLSSWNSAVMEFPWRISESLAFYRLLQLLSPYLMKSFGSYYHLSNLVRGPLHHFHGGAWLREYRSLLYQPQRQIGMVGPLLVCELNGAYIKPHTFMINTAAIPVLLSFQDKASENIDLWNNFIKKRPLFLSNVLLQAQYNISSYLYWKRVNLSYFDGSCLSIPEAQKDYRFHDPSKWCDITSDEVIFYEFGGDLLRIPGMLCDKVQDINRRYLYEHAYEINQLNAAIKLPNAQNLQHHHYDAYGTPQRLKLPETIYSGYRYVLYHQYEKEIYRNFLVSQSLAYPSSRLSLSSTVSQSLSTLEKAIHHRITLPIDPEGNKVCFLVRTAKMHGTKHNNGPVVESVAAAGIDDIMESLLRQTDPNWEAIFFITDNRPFETILTRMLRKYNDSRVSYFDVPLQYRPAYSAVDAAYTPTDYVLSKVLHRKDCRWISATNADNIYGTKVVENIRKTKQIEENDEEEGIPDLVFAPLDSRNIADQDYDVRKSRDQWNQFCVGITAMMKMNALTYTMQPRPFVGKVDLAAVFFQREKLAQENILFGNFTDPHRYRCKGCQDGYFTEYLVHSRLWTYKRLPIDGLRSIIFHGPSPTWCIASGNVWFDHPDVGKVRCYSHKTANSIRYVDVPPKYIFDWSHFDEQERVCLRFSQAGFQKYQSVKNQKSKQYHHQQQQQNSIANAFGFKPDSNNNNNNGAQKGANTIN